MARSDLGHMPTIQRVAALFVEKNGIYDNRIDVDPWDIERDARGYTGTDPVVAHPPCFLWVNMAAVNWKRYQRQKPAWYPGGTDGDCFIAALAAIRHNGGVLEHPASSHAWDAYGLDRPQTGVGWQAVRTMRNDFKFDEWTCEVWQSAYGHPARKRTWLYYCGERKPFELDWTQKPGTHQIGWFDRIKPTLGKKDANRTPLAFAELLIALAQHSRTP